MFKLDFGVVRVSIKCNYGLEIVLSSPWDKWTQGTYPDPQSPPPITWVSESRFVEIPSDRLLVNSSGINLALRTTQSCVLYPKWETNPLLGVPEVAREIEQVARHSGNLIYISHDYILTIDRIHESTHEFYGDIGRRKSRVNDIILLLVPFMKYTLPMLRSTLIHAAGILTHDRRTIILLAQSGGGKTTATKLAQKSGYRILGDDSILISQRNGSYFASAVPFNRITDGPDWGRIGAFVVLKQGPFFALVAGSPVDTLRKTWTDNSSQWVSLARESRKSLFSLYSDMFSDVPVYEMTFEKDFVDWAAIESVLKVS